MTEITREAAHCLAVRYEAYAAAVIRAADSPERDRAIAHWGPALIEIQAATGIPMMSVAGIAAVVAGARDRIVARRIAARAAEPIATSIRRNLADPDQAAAYTAAAIAESNAEAARTVEAYGTAWTVAP